MARTRVINMLKNPKYLALAITSSILIAGIYIYSQVLGIIQNIDLWFSIIPLPNLILFTIFSLLFGITLAYQIYVWRQPKVCSIKNKVKGAGASGAGTFGLFFVAQCPACASLGALFLPVSAITFLTKYSIPINLIGIGLLLFTLNYLGGFKKD